jgi:hypothetical protein
LVWWVAGPWRFVLLFLLFGATAAVVGLAAALIERTWVALAAFVVGSLAPLVAVTWWVVTGSHDV